MTSEELFNWCCEQKCTKSYLGNCDLCNYNKGKTDGIDECIEMLNGIDKQVADLVKELFELKAKGGD